MKPATVRNSASNPNFRRLRWSSVVLLIASALVVLSLAAQTPNRPSNADSPATAPGTLTPVTAPNYALEARFLPDSVNKLVFDLAVTPHWFTP